MNWLHRLFQRRNTVPVSLSEDQQAALAAWAALPAVSLDEPSTRGRYIVVDVEASGLDLKKDRLISIGAVGIVDGSINPADSFEVVLRQEEVSGEANILIHGIGAGAQRTGVDPAAALLQFLDYAGKAPLVAYHAWFDHAMVADAMRRYLGFDWEPVWIDLAWVLPELLPDIHSGDVALDEWLSAFGIEISHRHNAVADSWATAMLFQVAMARGRFAGVESAADFLRKERVRRWRRR